MFHTGGSSLAHFQVARTAASEGLAARRGRVGRAEDRREGVQDGAVWSPRVGPSRTLPRRVFAACLRWPNEQPRPRGPDPCE